MRKVQDAEIGGKRVLCRLDLNVPFLDDGSIADTNRIDASLPTLNLLLDKGAGKVIILSHRGQPKIYPDLSLSLEKVAEYLAKTLSVNNESSQPVRDTGAFPESLDVFQVSDRVYLVENVRFSDKEELNDQGFAKELASQADIFVFDAFASAHRAHASTVGVTNFLPSYSGLLVQKELENLTPLKDNPNRPYVAIIGGAKIKDKLPVIEGLASKVDHFLIGGAIGNTFLKASGIEVGNSIIEDDQVKLARDYLDRFSGKIVIPTDFVWDDNRAIVDIGKQTIMAYEDYLADAATIFWNGNLGKTEEREYSKGSLMLADFLARSPEITRVVSGGDTVGFLDQHHLTDKMTFASTGGGATLEFLAGKSLPALDALN